MSALTIPGIDIGVWQLRHKSDPAARALADRHYSRQTPGSNQIGPPGRKLVLVSPDESALWLSHWPEPLITADLLDAWRCAIFRNEGTGLSSELIRRAMDLTANVWGDVPRDGWVTWVDTRKVASPNPGYCFKQAGWWLDANWHPPRGRRGKVRLRAAVPEASRLYEHLLGRHHEWVNRSDPAQPALHVHLHQSALDHPRERL